MAGCMKNRQIPRNQLPKKASRLHPPFAWIVNVHLLVGVSSIPNRFELPFGWMSLLTYTKKDVLTSWKSVVAPGAISPNDVIRRSTSGI